MTERGEHTLGIVERLREWRQREVQAIGAAISTRNWHDLEAAYNSLRDKMDRVLHSPEWVTIAARDGIEAQHGLNDTFPGDPVKVRARPEAADLISELVGALEDCASGLEYVRHRHGELEGVGFDRALGRARAAAAKARGGAESKTPSESPQP